MQNQNSCGCCDGISQETPVRILNRPGLNAVVYRAGTYAKFRESLLAALSDNRFPALHALTTRDNDDFTIALLDAWSVVSDVFTFYQERIVNESFLGTATEQRSVLELARLIGYELKPGVAAGTYLAFTIENNSLAPGQIEITGNKRASEDPIASIIPVGTKVQSIPGPDEMPQFFETVEPLEAMAAWNAIKPKLGLKQTELAQSQYILVVNGTSNDLKPNDLLLIVENGNPVFRNIIRLETNDQDQTTSIYMADNATYRTFVEPELAPNGVVSNAVVLNDLVVKQFTQQMWKENDFSAMLKSKKWASSHVKNNLSKLAAPSVNTQDGVYVFRKRAAAFGYNAQKFYMNYDDDGNPQPPPTAHEWTIENTNDKRIYLDGAFENIKKGSFIAVKRLNENPILYTALDVEIRPRTAYGISGKTTAIYTDKNDSYWGAGNTLASLRPITFFVESEKLTLALSPVNNLVSGNKLTLSGLYPGLTAGKRVIVFGERSDLEGTYQTEHHLINEVYVFKGETTVVFDKDLAYTYLRKTFSINANVAEATHGETVKEVMGSGNAARMFQKFELKNAPLTYISAASPSGTKSTLEVRVNDVLWKEVPSLYGMGPNDHVYITRQDDNAKTTVTFGDGKTGARLPTGQDNIRAVYRKGIGAEGLLRADQISQLVSRPLGVKAVTNPAAPEGAQDREKLADARKNATLTIFTLGRVVSLQDYEDFARSFAGIAKSLATWSWGGQKRRIFLTVAGQNGDPVEPGSTLYNNLLTAIIQAGIPEVPVELHTYVSRFFRLEGNLIVHPDHLPDKVLTSVEAALRNHFSFEARSFGQGVALSEVMSVVQQVEGVVAVDLDYLYRTDGPRMLSNILPSNSPMPGSESPQPAELLILDPQKVLLNLMS